MFYIISYVSAIYGDVSCLYSIIKYGIPENDVKMVGIQLIGYISISGIPYIIANKRGKPYLNIYIQHVFILRVICIFFEEYRLGLSDYITMWTYIFNSFVSIYVSSFKISELTDNKYIQNNQYLLDTNDFYRNKKSNLCIYISLLVISSITIIYNLFKIITYKNSYEVPEPNEKDKLEMDI